MFTFMAAETPPITPQMSPPGLASQAPGRRRAGTTPRWGDPIFLALTLLFACSVLALCGLIAFNLWGLSLPAIGKFGAKFITSTVWRTGDDPVAPDTYGAWPFIAGTLYTSALALLLAVPVGIGTAVFLAELAPRWMRGPFGFLVELLAAVPSVVYGLWGRVVLVPFLAPMQDKLSEKFPGNPLFGEAPVNNSLLAASLVLAIMILPFITAVSREVIKAVPPTQREAAFGLGATHWEAVKGPILRYARSGIMGAVILGLARALGETMAMTIVLGNADTASWSLFSGGATLASKLANNFAEADGMQRSALIYLALVLFGITIAVNALARLMLWNMARGMKGAARE